MIWSRPVPPADRHRRGGSSRPSPGPRRRQRWTSSRRHLLVSVVAAAVASLSPGVGQVFASQTEELRPTTAHTRSARAVVELMNRYHYRRVALDDELGGRILDRYIDLFDPAHSVFLAGDIAEFERHRTEVDDALRRGRLDIAFEVFHRYRTRMAERASAAAELVDREFDFARDEQLELDRADAPWASNLADLDDYWRRRVKNDILELELAGHDRGEIPETLKARYSRMARRVTQINADDVVQYFLNAYTQSIDPHSSYFSPRSSENFRIRMSLSLEGIGAALQTVGEHTVVRRIIAGGPADRSGQLGIDDRIIGVRQAGEEEMTDVVSWRIEDVVNLIRGPKGSTVYLQILPTANPSGPPRTLSLVRDRIDLDDQSASGRVLETRTIDGTTARVGIIDIPSFYLDISGRNAGREDYRSTSRDVRRLIEQLRQEDLDGLVVDLRDNQGGALDEALLVAGLFIETGPVVQIRRLSGRARVRWDEDPFVAWEGPLGILVNRASASASEILAGAIQDYGRGLVIGTRTYGKGTVQNLVDLPSYGGTGRLKLTISQYFRVNGEGVQRRGIEPDVDFEPVAAEAHGGEGQLDNALPWARVKAVARWKGERRHDETIAAARTLSRNRLRADGPVGILHEEIENRRRLRDAGTVSLNRARRETEQAELETERVRVVEALSRAIASEGDDEAPADAENFSELRDEFFLAEAARIVADFAFLDQQGSGTNAAH